ncbi:MAG: nickel pincer cofactor biosynthesis protein LarC [Roseburia sp.]|nr:nickel pincer cofactor biosynthesis protein LarC [Roseburia sp.]MCM1278708.1 nickel pincer cofactor biosynthesis protein LarC [Robinsoniella sp.]
MGNTLYLECTAGISGDMTVAALLDLGADRDVLMKVLNSIPVKGFSIETGRVKKAGIDCCDFRVILDERHENHDHDMEYLHGHHESGHHHGGEVQTEHHHGGEMQTEHHHGGERQSACQHEVGIQVDCQQQKEGQQEEQGKNALEAQDHDHIHDHAHHHHHEHRGIQEIRQILAQCTMTKNAGNLADRIFQILAEAEAKAHNVPIEQVHFHEVGAIDSIVDIVAVAVCLDNLAIENVIVPKLCEGTGTVRCQHGILPVPVPAVANILKAHALKVEIMDVQGEFVTPTGAAIVAAIKTGDTLPKGFSIKEIGIGAGKRNYERPSILRAMLIEEESEDKDTVYKLESNVDDCTGEALGYVMERLFEAGARDVHYIPVFMKKNRPAWQLNVICKKEDIRKLEQIIFQETTTIGIRRMELERTVLQRELQRVETPYGQAVVKKCQIGEQIRLYPEYGSVTAICKKSGLSFQEVYQMIVEQCKE